MHDAWPIHARCVSGVCQMHVRFESDRTVVIHICTGDRHLVAPRTPIGKVGAAQGIIAPTAETGVSWVLWLHADNQWDRSGVRGSSALGNSD